MKNLVLKDGDAIFKKQMEEIFIPSIYNMIEKETAHLQSLKIKSTFFRNPITKRFILRSETFLKHLHLRLQQYKDYAAQL